MRQAATRHRMPQYRAVTRWGVKGRWQWAQRRTA